MIVITGFILNDYYRKSKLFRLISMFSSYYFYGYSPFEASLKLKPYNICEDFS